MFRKLVRAAFMIKCVVSRNFETCDRNAGFNPPPSLKRIGTTIILQSNLALKSGGARGLHALHSSLLKQGMNTLMHYVHPELGEVNFVRNMSFEAWEELLDKGLDTNDVLVRSC